MTTKQLLKTLQFSSPRVIYIVNWQNKLQILRCSFKVKVLKPVNGLELGKEYLVNRIWNTDELKTVFEINGEYYNYFNFDIIM